MAEEADRTARQRFPLLRLRCAEERQARAIAQLEHLGVRLFTVPEGVMLQKVEIQQLPGDQVLHHFTVSGIALTRQHFSVGPLATYLGSLNAHPGMRLEPLREVSVSDQMPGDGSARISEQAITRFLITGTAP